jgi:mevalonate kinase
MDPKVREPLVQELGKFSQEMREALKQKDFEKVKVLMNLAQKNLASLGVSTPAIDKIHKKVSVLGGAAKLCGAGGGGVVLCYHTNKDLLAKTVRSLGFEPWETELGVEGVRVEG